MGMAVSALAGRASRIVVGLGLLVLAGWGPALAQGAPESPQERLRAASLGFGPIQSDLAEVKAEADSAD